MHFKTFYNVFFLKNFSLEDAKQFFKFQIFSRRDNISNSERELDIYLFYFFVATRLTGAAFSEFNKADFQGKQLAGW